MSGSIYMATSGAEVQRLRLEILSNNLANINTTGFKEDRAIFRLPEQVGPSAATDGIAPDGVSALAPSVIPDALNPK